MEDAISHVFSTQICLGHMHMWQLHMWCVLSTHESHVHVQHVYGLYMYDKQIVVRRRRQGGCGGRSPPLVCLNLFLQPYDFHNVFVQILLTCNDI